TLPRTSNVQRPTLNVQRWKLNVGRSVGSWGGRRIPWGFVSAFQASDPNRTRIPGPALARLAGPRLSLGGLSALRSRALRFALNAYVGKADVRLALAHLLPVFLAAFLISGSATAQTSLTIGSTPGYPGVRYALPVTLSRATNIVAAQFDVAFDP